MASALAKAKKGGCCVLAPAHFSVFLDQPFDFFHQFKIRKRNKILNGRSEDFFSLFK
jgi:hypothetical protein